MNAWLGGKRRRRSCPASRSSSREPRTRRRLIRRKRDGEELSAAELAELVLAYARGDVPDYQMAAFCMAVFFRGLTPPRRTRSPTRWCAAARRSTSSALGRQASSTSTRPAAWATRRRSSIGPIVAACGVPFAKMSGRGLGHTGGTLDKLESIPGLPRRAHPGRVHRAGARGRDGDHRPDRRPRPGGQAALRAARRDRDRGSGRR